MKQKLPLISIILPVYNGEKFLANAINSCLAQTYSNFELIIVNDCSTDNTLQIIQDFQILDTRLKLINNTENLKLPKSLNIGHDAARGEFLTWTSDDNILKPNFLDCLYSSLVEENNDLVFSNYDVIWNSGEVKRAQIAGPVEELIFGDVIGASFLYKKKVYKTLKGYNTDFFLVEDYYFFLKASLRFNFKHLNKNLYQYRLHPNSLSSKIAFDKEFSNKHEGTLIRMFKEITASLGFNKITIELINDLYFNKAFDIDVYLNNKLIIKCDLLNFQNTLKNPENNNVLDLLNNKIFWNLYHRKPGISFLTFIKILRYENSIFNNKMSNRNSIIRFIYKSLKI